MTDFLHPTLHNPAHLDALRAQWAETQNLRLAPLLTEEAAEQLLQTVREQSFQLNAIHFGDFNHLYWHFFFRPGEGHPLLSSFAAWLRADLCALVSALTGRLLAPTSTGQSVATLYTHGCYLDIHNDGGHDRSVAFVVGLTPGRWPEEEGGGLEFLAPSGRGVVVTERRRPGWNSLDLFDVAADPPLHRIPMVTGAHERRAFSGWFYAASPPEP